ncbi:MAG: permease [Rhodospirillaceae bacterium]|jgi:uncharacterized protein|nr:permease [Rhodospirillaceae bacterium]MBT4490655.1 permease [Rhodospirillaceae bacterium]MBT5194040.1 permease [Rhodospirillaceae bacterium]MBT5897946.1 permease [Rhodospirillaceae bacterium]MBT6428413.1 permease [Rhodospirillaceae bacterium]
MSDISLSIAGAARRVYNIDKVWLAIAAGLLLGAVFVPQQTISSVGFAGDGLLSIAPFLAISIGLAAYAKASGADNLIAMVFQGRPVQMVFAAALFGALSPFCSCGVIPLIAALLAMGVPLAPVMAFWLASPLMDPQMFLLTMGALGLPFAIGKTAAALGVGLLGGFATLTVQRAGGFSLPLREGVGNGGCGAGSVRSDGDVVWKFWQDGARRLKFTDEAWKTTLFLGKWLLVAFLLESVMLAYVPAETIAGLLGGDSFWAIPLAAIVGVPAYMNGFAAIPLMSGLMELGMAPGAAMAFMVAGGVSCIPAAIAVFALVRLQVFFWYLGLALAGSLVAGISFQMFIA